MATNNGKSAPAAIAKAGDNISKALADFLATVTQIGVDWDLHRAGAVDSQLKLGFKWREAVDGGLLKDEKADFDKFMTAFRPDAKADAVSGVLRANVRSFGGEAVRKAMPDDKAYDIVRDFVAATPKKERGGRDLFQCCYAVNAAIKKAAADKKPAPKITANWLKANIKARAEPAPTPEIKLTPTQERDSAIETLGEAIGGVIPFIAKLKGWSEADKAALKRIAKHFEQVAA